MASSEARSAHLKECLVCRVAAQDRRNRFWQPTESFKPQIRVRASKRKERVISEPLKGWRAIASFLGQPASVAQRWAGEGMPVRRQGRFVTSTPEELNRWLGEESGKPVHVVTDVSDLAAELKRGILFVRNSHHEEPGDRPAKAVAGTRRRKSS